MSIATRIESIENHLTDDYTEIARLGADLTNVDKNIENIAEAVREAYSKMPKVLGTGSNISLSPALKGGLDITPIGACEQDTFSGKNLLNAYAESYDFDAETDNKIIEVGTLDLIANIKYYISYNVDTATTSSTRNTPQIRISQTGSTTYTQNAGSNYNLTTGRKVWEFTPTESGHYQLRYWCNKLSNDISVSQFMISTLSDTTYEKFVGGIPSPNPTYPQDIRVVTGDNDVVVQNENWFNKTTMTFVRGVIQDDETISTTNPYVATSGKISLRKGTYTFYNSVVTNWLFYIQCFQNGTRVYQTPVGTNAKGHTFTLEDDYDIHIQLNSPFGSNVNVDSYLTDLTNNAFLLVGEIATEPTYIAHAEQKVTLHLGTNYLAGIGDYVDTIVGKKDDWKIKRKVYKKQVLSTDNITYNQANDVFVYGEIANMYNPDIIPLCNYFQGVEAVSGNSGAYAKGNNKFCLRTGTTDRGLFTYFNHTLEEFKTLLDNNDVFIYFVLATPTEETITDTTLISVLNNMYNLMGYDGQTNITISSNSANAQMTAQVKALKGE